MISGGGHTGTASTTTFSRYEPASSSNEPPQVMSVSTGEPLRRYRSGESCHFGWERRPVTTKLRAAPSEAVTVILAPTGSSTRS